MPSAEYQREWKKRNPEKQAEYCKKWRDKNPGKQAELSKKWYHENKDEYGPTRHRNNKTPEQLEKLRAQDKKSREKHRDKRNAETKEWCERNKEHRIEYNRDWYLKNRDRVLKGSAIKRSLRTEEEKLYAAQVMKAWRATETGKRKCRSYTQRRRARKRNAEGSFTAEDIKDLYATQGGRCYYCSVEIENGYHIEHMVPLSRGGRNDVSNICLACAPCNLRKHTQTATEFKETFKGETNEEAIACT